MAKRKTVEKIKCPISGAALPYGGRGRPPIYHPNISKAVRRAWAAGRKVGKVGKDIEGVYVVL